jgi:hypothetical protein
MADILGSTAAGALGGSAAGPVGTVVGAGIGAASSLIGGLISNSANSANVQATNAQNLQISREANQFNAEQARNAANYQQANILQAEEYDMNMALESQAWSAQQGGIARDFNSAEALKARQFSADQAAIQRDYETTMSNSAYQRATADMKAAGINPILAYQQGGASTPSVGIASGPSASTSAPSGATASVGIPGPPPTAHANMIAMQPARFQDVITPAVSSGLSVMQGLQAINESMARTGNQQADTLLKKTIIPEKLASEKNLTNQDINVRMADEDLRKTQNKTQQNLLNLQNAQIEAAYAAAVNSMSSANSADQIARINKQDADYYNKTISRAASGQVGDAVGAVAGRIKPR